MKINKALVCRQSTYCVIWCSLSLSVRVLMMKGTGSLFCDQALWPWINGRNASLLACVRPLCCACMDTLPPLPLPLSPVGTSPLECAEARESTKKKKLFQKAALTATSSSASRVEGGPTHCRTVYGCGSAGLRQQFKETSFKKSWNFFPPASWRCVHFFKKQIGADGFQLNDDLNPKTRKNLIDYWNCDMNRPYKMPAVVGGRRAQKREVFSVIHLLQSFVLCCGKQRWQPASFDPTKYDVPGPEPFPVIRNRESWNWLYNNSL